LVIALILVWMVGLAGASEGCQTIDVLHRPEAVRAALNHITNAQIARRQEALIEPVLAFRTIVTPFAVGQLILGTLLTLTAGLTLLGRGQARRLAMQAILAYSLFLPIDYIVTRPMLASKIDALASDLALWPLEGGVALEIGDLREILWWAQRGILGGQLAILIAGLFVMTRPRVRAFFGTIAGEQPGRLEP
jgi:hypothetical protein